MRVYVNETISCSSNMNQLIACILVFTILTIMIDRSLIYIKHSANQSR